MTAKKKRNTLDDVDLKPLAVYTLFDSVLPTDTGIYAIVNIKSRKFYIGSTKANGNIPSAKGFRVRIAKHRRELRECDHHCRHLQNSYCSTIDKGIDPNEVYQVWILEYVERDRCLEVEQWYLDTYRPTYNGTLLATCGDHERTPEMRERSSEVRSIVEYVGISPSGEVHYFKSAPKFAKKHNLIKSHIYKSAQNHKHHKRWRFFYKDDPILTDEHLKSVVADQKSKYRLYVAVSPTGDILEFDDPQAFARKHKLKTAKVNDSANGKYITYKKWHIYYADDPVATKEYIRELSESKKAKSLLPGKYLAISPGGDLYYFDSYHKFSKEHDLEPGNISGCLSGHSSHHRYWKFYYADDQRLTDDFIASEVAGQPHLVRYEYVGISPQGEVFYFDNAAKFIESRNGEITKHGVSGCAKGHLETHAGWRFYFLQNTTPEFIEEMIKLQLRPKYIGISPEGKVYFFNSPVEFAKEHPVTSQGINSCTNGRLITHRRWNFMFYIDDIIAA
jgi:group I intron endonuclease